MSNGLVGARFSFGTESEVRYILSLPTVGDFVMHHHELWRVSSTGEDQVGLYVFCEHSSPPTPETDPDRV